jgi:hypothetical protein
MERCAKKKENKELTGPALLEMDGNSTYQDPRASAGSFDRLKGPSTNAYLPAN